MRSNSYMILVLILLLSSVGTLVMGQSKMTNYGNLHIHAKGTLAVHGSTDFNSNKTTLNSTERTASIGSYTFLNGGTWQNANDSNYIDGYATHLGSNNFIFPTGDNQSYRPFGKKGTADNITGAYFNSNPAQAITSNPTGGNYPTLPSTGPFDITSLSSELFAVSSIEYWDINSDQPSQITLTWNSISAISNITALSLDRLTIVGWRNGQWEEITSTIDPQFLNTSNNTYGFGTNASSFNQGSITSETLIPDDYDVITFGALRCKKNQTIVQEDLKSPSLCRNNDGSITWSGLDPLINYAIQYTYNNNSINKAKQSDVNGNLQLADLGAGDYALVTIDDGLCLRSIDDFQIIDDPVLDSDMDGLTDCEEVDMASDPYDPCSPNPLGNLDADCDGDNIRNRDDCAPLNTKALSFYDCDERTLQLDVSFDKEPWLNNVKNNYKWYDSDPDATPNVAQLISEEKAPKLFNLAKGFYNFYVTVEFDGCPTPGKSNVNIEIEDLSTVSEDEYTFDFVRDTIYLLNVIENDNIDLINNQLFIQDPPSNATVNTNLDGTISFIPRSGFSGEIVFSYVVCNLSCLDDCEEAIVRINIITPDCDFIPNGFSPNGDGVNDVLEITCLDKFPGSSLTVFNRWGDEVFSSPDYKNDWEGTWNGKKLPSGTYYYALNVKDRQQSAFYGYVYIQH